MVVEMSSILQIMIICAETVVVHLSRIMTSVCSSKFPSSLVPPRDTAMLVFPVGVADVARVL